MQVLERPGSVSTIGAAFAGETWLRASSDSAAFVVNKEDCTLAYAGDTLVNPLASTTLAADLGEQDSSLGNRSGKTITFTLTNSAGAQTQYTAQTNASGRATVITPLVADAYGVSVAFAGDAYYKACAPDTDTLVTVQAAAAKVTGGGWTSVDTGRTDFGFNAIPQAGGVYKGQLQLRAKNGKDKFHGANVATFSSSGATATWTGTGKWNGTSGYTYSISVVDGGPSGAKKSDTISVTVKSPTNTIVHTTNGAQALKGGNITVR